MFECFKEYNTQIITGSIVNLYKNTILIDRFLVFRTVYAKCLKNVVCMGHKIASKLTQNSFKLPLRVTLLAAKIIRVNFLGLYKDLCEYIFHFGQLFVCFSVYFH